MQFQEISAIGALGAVGTQLIQVTPETMCKSLLCFFQLQYLYRSACCGKNYTIKCMRPRSRLEAYFVPNNWSTFPHCLGKGQANHLCKAKQNGQLAMTSCIHGVYRLGCRPIKLYCQINWTTEPSNENGDLLVAEK